MLRTLSNHPEQGDNRDNRTIFLAISFGKPFSKLLPEDPPSCSRLRSPPSKPFTKPPWSILRRFSWSSPLKAVPWTFPHRVVSREDCQQQSSFQRPVAVAVAAAVVYSSNEGWIMHYSWSMDGLQSAFWWMCKDTGQLRSLFGQISLLQEAGIPFLQADLTGWTIRVGEAPSKVTASCNLCRDSYSFAFLRAHTSPALEATL